MRVKVLSRDPQITTRDRVCDPMIQQHNLDPALHPLEKPLEYARAVVAAKKSRLFAKPFLGALSGIPSSSNIFLPSSDSVTGSVDGDGGGGSWAPSAGHSDGVWCMARHPSRIGLVVSGACDGEIRLWDLSLSSGTNAKTHGFWIDSCRLVIPNAHSGFVRGLAWSRAGSQIVSCGSDGRVGLWQIHSDSIQILADSVDSSSMPTFTGGRKGLVRVWSGDPSEKNTKKKQVRSEDQGFYDLSYTSVDYSALDDHRFLAAATTGLVLFNVTRAGAELVFSSTMNRGFSSEGFTSVKFHKSEPSLFAACTTDRGILLGDLRSRSIVRKLVMSHKTNRIVFNPQNPLVFAAANEDCNAYSFDIRKLDSASCVYMDHVGPVLDVDYSPTGRELVTASYDRTIRIYPVDHGRSRDVYHTKRMQRVFSVAWSLDAQTILTGSDDAQIRLWKARSDAIVHRNVDGDKEKSAIEYSQKLLKRWGHMTEVKRIVRHRHVPKAVLSARRKRNIIDDAKSRREENARKHAAKSRSKDDLSRVAERRKHIVAIEE
eukprot:ANDGO_01856.mRNA.1 DDB1- and CUL4-associated factor 13